jgi:phosphopantetheine--protein transferase-like protein
LLRETPEADLARLFSANELRDAGEGPGRAASLAARFAAKEACVKLFPRETALGKLGQADFTVARDNYGAPRVLCSPAALDVLARNRVAAIAISLTHDRTSASAVAVAEPARARVSTAGSCYYLLPLPRRDPRNLRRVTAMTPDEITRLRNRTTVTWVAWPWIWLHGRPRSARPWHGLKMSNLSRRRSRKARACWCSRVTSATGKWRPLPGWAAIRRRAGDSISCGVRSNRAGLTDLSRDGSSARASESCQNAGDWSHPDRLAAGDLVVYPLDQHASRRDGVVVDFFGHPASTFRSLAILALNTGAPVVPAASWREPDGRHVLRFEEPLAAIEVDNVNEAIRRNTRAYNAALERMILRPPEQWWWAHRRWKVG